MVVAPAGTTATWLNAGLTTSPSGCKRVISMGPRLHYPLTEATRLRSSDATSSANRCIATGHIDIQEGSAGRPLADYWETPPWPYLCGSPGDMSIHVSCPTAPLGWSAGLKLPRQPEPVEHFAVERDDLGYQALFNAQHVHGEGLVHRGPRTSQVQRHCRLAVGRRGSALPIGVVAAAEAAIHPALDGLVPADPNPGLRRHREAQILTEQRAQPIDVEALVCLDVRRHQPPLVLVQSLPGPSTPVEPAFGQVFAHGDTGPLQGTVRRRQREFQGVGRLLRRPAEHVAEDQDRPLPRGQVLDGHDERQFDGLPGHRPLVWVVRL